MTWTYTNKPSTVNRDAVRFLIRDIDDSNPLITDEEITFALSEESNIYLAASMIAVSLGAKFAGKADKAVGDLKITYKSSADAYKQLADTLRVRGNRTSALPFAGGISQSQKETVRLDSDRVAPSFRRGITDNPRNLDVDDGDYDDDYYQ